MRNRIVLGILLLAVVFNQFSFLTYASEDTIAQMQQQEAETQEAISNLERETQQTKAAISELEGQKAQTEESVQNLETQKGELQTTIRGYSNKLTSLNAEISDAQDAMAEVSSEIVQLNNELSDARQMEKDRYELLKKRLKSTYESGGTSGLLQIMLESGTLTEFLTKFEYLNAIVEYDRRKLAEYRQLQADIEAKKTVVEEKEDQLDAYQTTLDEKHDELSALNSEVKGQLSATNSSIDSEMGKLADYDNQLKSLDAKMKSLESQTAAAQAKLAQQIAERLALQKEDTSGSYSASYDEKVWLAATIQAEADGESYTGKLAVGSVIMNRVKSSAFPGSVIGVITQNLQFASYRSGKVELICARGPNSTCTQAAEEVLNGARVGDYLFFMTQYYADYYRIKDYTMIGNHAFFYRWETYDPPPEENPEESSEGQPAEGQPEGEQQQEQEGQQSEEQQQEEQQSEENSEGG